MRSVFAIAALALLAVGAAADNHMMTCTRPAGALMAGSCTRYADCGRQFCGCVGNTANGNATTCLAGGTANCTRLATCLTAYASCVHDLAAYRSNTSSPCYMLASQIHTQDLTLAAMNYSGSPSQGACLHRTCMVLSNASSFATQCSTQLGGANYTNVCVAPPAPVVRPPPAITATLRIPGAAFGLLLADPAKKAQLTTAVSNALATLLNVAARFIRIIAMYEGSLVVDFAVETGSGVSVDALQATLSSPTAVGNTAWLTEIQTVYSTVSSDTLTGATVSAVAIPTTTTTTAGPTTSGAATTASSGPATTTTPAPGPSPSSASAVATAVAAVAAFAAALVL